MNYFEFKKRLAFFYFISSISLCAQEDDFIAKMIFSATKDSPSVISKVNSLNAAKSTEKGAFWQYFPSPSASVENGRGGVSSKVMKLQQPLWAGGRIDAGYNKAKTETQSAEMSVEEAKQSVAVSVVQSLNSVLTSHGHVLVKKEAVSRLEEHKKMIERRVDSGVSPQADLLLVNSRLLQAKNDYSIALATRDKDLAQLEQWLAKKVTLEDLEPILPKKACVMDQINEYKNDRFVESVLDSSPILKRLLKQIESANYDIDIKKAALWPSIVANAEHQWNSGSSTNINSSQTNYTVGLQYTPGAGLSSYTAIQASEASLLALKSDFETSKLELKQKMMSELTDYEFTRDRYSNYVFGAETTKKTAESYLRQFVAGKKSWLDVLNSEKELSDTQISLSDVQAYLMTTPVKLKAYASELDWQKGMK